ncbi:hypothetical protein HW555_013728 [Spodoptera exigua]|uniref:Uncharacterized protein n=1 Tax=Spodoptera exigua TaxID=7107 RepID=A0A835G461_SPOEX|nr:hypothetical protein HW555_013728 [Spodoptera exigua]
MKLRPDFPPLYDMMVFSTSCDYVLDENDQLVMEDCSPQGQVLTNSLTIATDKTLVFCSTLLLYMLCSLTLSYLFIILLNKTPRIEALYAEIQAINLVQQQMLHVLRRDRGTPCGGVLLMARAPIVLRRRRELETECGEDLWASFTCRSSRSSVYVCVVYIKPSATDSDYMTWFTKVESFINDLKGTESASLHDVLVTTVEGLVPPDAYHPPLDIQVKLQSSVKSERLEPSNVDRGRDWNFNKCNRSLLFELLSEVSWDAVLSLSVVRTSTRVFYDTIYRLFDACIPKKRRNVRATRRYPTWFTSDIIRDLQYKIKLHSAWKRSKCDLIYRQFSECRSSLKSRISAAYNTYIGRIERNIKKNPKEFWQHITNLRSKGGFECNITHKGIMHRGIAAAEAFAEYFASVFHTEVPTLNTEDIANPRNSNMNSDFDLRDAKDVIEYCSKFSEDLSLSEETINEMQSANADAMGKLAEDEANRSDVKTYKEDSEHYYTIDSNCCYRAIDLAECDLHLVE